MNLIAISVVDEGLWCEFFFVDERDLMRVKINKQINHMGVFIIHRLDHLGHFINSSTLLSSENKTSFSLFSFRFQPRPHDLTSSPPNTFFSPSQLESRDIQYIYHHYPPLINLIPQNLHFSVCFFLCGEGDGKKQYYQFVLWS